MNIQILYRSRFLRTEVETVRDHGKGAREMWKRAWRLARHHHAPAWNSPAKVLVYREDADSFRSSVVALTPTAAWHA